MKKRYPHKSNVLLVNITRLGDMLQATPTIAGIKMENPSCKITVLVEKQFAAICHALPYIDEVVSIDLTLMVRAMMREGEGVLDGYDYLSEFIEDMRKRCFDYCLNMSSSAYTALLISLLGIDRSGGWTADNEGYRRIQSEWARLFATSVFHQNRIYNSLNLVDIFRCSADVAKHPNHLLMEVTPDDASYVEALIRESGFVGNGPLIAIQSGASQMKRQWDPVYFGELVKRIRADLGARIVLIGSPKERALAEQITAISGLENVFIAAGHTTIGQLGALLKVCDLLVTGDTGPMHMATAVGTPVVAMFLASAYGFETGPYSADNIVLQPIIGCGPCNPNKACARPDCHSTMSPELIAKLVSLRMAGPVTALLDAEFRSSVTGVHVYRTLFDENGFFDMEPISPGYFDPVGKFRGAYRALWLEELGGLPASGVSFTGRASASKLAARFDPELADGIAKVSRCASAGLGLIARLVRVIGDTSAPPSELGALSDQLTAIDREVEALGFHHGALGPVTRMFVFGKENLELEDAVDLAREMGNVYEALGRRVERFAALLQ